MAKHSRLKLHDILVSIMAESKLWEWDPFNFYTGVIPDEILKEAKTRVYFQPPENVLLKYPCIIYHVSNGDSIYADNIPYRSTTRYQVTIIDRDPDSEIRDRVAKLRMCTWDRSFRQKDLNHDIFNLYF